MERGYEVFGVCPDSIALLPLDIQEEIKDSLADAIGLNEFEGNVEKMYATSIFMSSRCCGSGTCD